MYGLAKSREHDMHNSGTDVLHTTDCCICQLQVASQGSSRGEMRTGKGRANQQRATSLADTLADTFLVFTSRTKKKKKQKNCPSGIGFLADLLAHAPKGFVHDARNGRQAGKAGRQAGKAGRQGRQASPGTCSHPARTHRICRSRRRLRHRVAETRCTGRTIVNDLTGRTANGEGKGSVKKAHTRTRTRTHTCDCCTSLAASGISQSAAWITTAADVRARRFRRDTQDSSA
ncbi:hypothetical protein IE81DRAFT_260177 [Ceraceosorus guamensis]|uniref:Uncharacterized protein n=1 Tax=Ceraceosorus guamensis TaxID=1522189 RepID=A0A316VQU0_9BASI|nr:hypothetical protein IE81DRAFT_260177 [Ceraceosorus guamensis]PWN39710.1 hypothetical protein IE81DRAFT_260177 [Ceraceosorus guamensis]